LSHLQVNGLLLHRRAYRESSYLLDIFSLEQGKFSAVVKGVRNSKSDKKSLLQAFQPLLLGISGRHELKTLGTVEASSASFNLQGLQLFSGMYLNEILNRVLVAELPHPELFAAYQSTLKNLADNQPIEPLLREFELLLLADLGYGIEFNVDRHGQDIVVDQQYNFVPEQGWSPIVASRYPDNTFSGEVLLQIEAAQWTAQSLRCAKILSRHALSQLLGSKPLKSRELFRQSWLTQAAVNGEQAE
jgi:DNA repair protein RecO (recombination protein O)